MIQNILVGIEVARFAREGAAVKRAYEISTESFEKVLIEMNFYKTKTTPMAIHYRRADVLHLVLSSSMRKKDRSYQKVKREVGKGEITIIKVHRDDVLFDIKRTGLGTLRFSSDNDSCLNLTFAVHKY